MEIIKINDQVTVELTDMDIKYIHILLSQAGDKEDSKKLIKDISLTKIKTVLNARKMYCDMFGPQYNEEKDLLPELLKVFDFIE